MRLLRYTLTIIFLILYLLDSKSQTRTVFPDSIWQKHDSIENIGYRPEKIKEIKRFIIDSLNTTGLVVIVDGEILFDYGNIEELSYIASCRKSVLSLMYGKYVANGVIDLGTTLEELGFDDIGGLLPVEKQATISDLLTARSGIYHPASNEGSENKNGPERGSIKPGLYFLYNNWDFNAAGAIFEEQTNQNIYDAFQKDIAIPIKMEEYYRDKQEKSGDLNKSRYLAYHFWFSTRDMARIGLLMLNNGNWNGEQLIPNDWIRTITSVVSPIDEMNPSWYRSGNYAYGYMWWIWKKYKDPNLEGSYLATGAYGQYLVIIPKLNMVIAHKTKSDYRRNTDKESFENLVYKILDAKLK